MRNAFCIIITILIFSCNSSSVYDKQNFGRVKISNQNFNQHHVFEHLFTCKDRAEDFESGYSKIEIKGKKAIIINSMNDGYESIQIRVEIDSSLKINNVSYFYSDDIEDGSQTDYKVIKAEINISKNLFQHKLNDISAFYLLKIKEINNPLEFWKSKEEREYYFKGKVICI